MTVENMIPILKIMTLQEFLALWWTEHREKRQELNVVTMIVALQGFPVIVWDVSKRRVVIKELCCNSVIFLSVVDLGHEFDGFKTTVVRSTWHTVELWASEQLKSQPDTISTRFYCVRAPRSAETHNGRLKLLKKSCCLQTITQCRSRACGPDTGSALGEPCV